MKIGNGSVYYSASFLASYCELFALCQLRKRLQGASSVKHFEDLNASVKVSHDYYTQDEMLRFKKPKKKKSLRKKEKLDIDALEAEAISSGLGVGDLGPRNDSSRQARKTEQERSEAEMRQNAYQSAYAKADEASRSLQLVQSSVRLDDNEDTFIEDDDEDLYKSLERARKLALKKQEAASGPEAVALLATTTTSGQTTDDQNTKAGELQENKVVFTEMEEFVWGLQLDEGIIFLILFLVYHLLLFTLTVPISPQSILSTVYLLVFILSPPLPPHWALLAVLAGFLSTFKLCRSLGFSMNTNHLEDLFFRVLAKSELQRLFA